VFGIPCPGCGLTTAIAELLRGDWRGSLSIHAFAPIFVVAFVIMLAAVVVGVILNVIGRASAR
jgi:hypothetical protein